MFLCQFFMLLIISRFSPFVQIVMPYWESKPVISGRHYAPVVGVGIGMESRDDITALGIRANIGKSLFTLQKNAFTVNTFRYGEFYVYLEKLFARMGSGRLYGGVELGDIGTKKSAEDRFRIQDPSPSSRRQNGAISPLGFFILEAQNL